jgi:hypothetical protein
MDLQNYEKTIKSHTLDPGVAIRSIGSLVKRVFLANNHKGINQFNRGKKKETEKPFRLYNFHHSFFLFLFSLKMQFNN